MGASKERVQPQQQASTRPLEAAEEAQGAPQQVATAAVPVAAVLAAVAAVLKGLAAGPGDQEVVQLQ